MADDGMLLNFVTPTADAWEPKAVFRGGRWKDRLTAKKSAEYGALKRKERAAGVPDRPAPRTIERVASDSLVADILKDGEGQAVKRRKVDFVPRSRDVAPIDRSGTRNKDDQTRQRPSQGTQGGDREVISSLFTYNPTASTPSAKPDEEDKTETQPSNAPLSAEEQTFTKLGLSLPLTQHLLAKLSIKAPTSIQRRALEQLLQSDTDAFLQAETGSGKTLAYLLPLVQRLISLSTQLKAATGQKMTRDSGLFAIVLAPTRELSRQISTVLETLLGCARWIVSGSVTGGEKKKSEKARLRKGLNVLVATPGRLADHLSNTEVLDVSKVRWLVLDEGDRLMELGFENDIQKLVSTLNLRMRKQADGDVEALLPSKRTTIMCSATMKMDVQRLGEISLKDAAHITADKREVVGNADGEEKGFQAPAQLKQAYAIAPAKQRLVTLVAVLRRAFARKGTTSKAIVFLSCADSVDFHFLLLSRQLQASSTSPADANGDVPATNEPLPKQKGASIPQGTILPETLTSTTTPSISNSSNPTTLYRLHGSLPQHTRTTTLTTFAKSDDPSILLCTDVASRGLDLPNIDYVIEYDPPFSFADHLHRIGRTARAGKPGRSLIFLMPGCEEGYVELLRASHSGSGSSIAGHGATELLRRGFAPTSGVVKGGDAEWEAAATEWQLDVERAVLEEPKMLEMARRAYQSHVRAYATHVGVERGVFDIKQLHLGHLAKAFGLRDRPGAIKVPGLRQGSEKVKREREKAGAGGKKGGEEEGEKVDDAVEARRKMLKMSRAMGGASEFNLG